MNKFFVELGYVVGDTVKCVQADPTTFYTVGEVYRLIPLEEKDQNWPTVYINDTYYNGIGARWLKVSGN